MQGLRLFNFITDGRVKWNPLPDVYDVFVYPNLQMRVCKGEANFRCAFDGGSLAVLQVNCALGDVPRERSVEGIRLNIERNGGEFSEEAGGRVMFLAMTPGMSTPVKAPQEEKTPETSEQPHN